MAIELLKHDTFLTNYLKLQILAPYNNLRIEQDSEFAQFSPRALLMSKLAKLLPLGMPKKVFSKSFTKIKLVSVPLLRLKVVPYV